jgi:hypothetical protein
VTDGGNSDARFSPLVLVVPLVNARRTDSRLHPTTPAMAVPSGSSDYGPNQPHPGRRIPITNEAVRPATIRAGEAEDLRVEEGGGARMWPSSPSRLPAHLSPEEGTVISAICELSRGARTWRTGLTSASSHITR